MITFSEGNTGFHITWKTAQQATMDRKGLKILIKMIHNQEITGTDHDYLCNLNKFTPTVEYAWHDEDFSGDPISYDPQLDPELKSYLMW